MTVGHLVQYTTRRVLLNKCDEIAFADRPRRVTVVVVVWSLEKVNFEFAFSLAWA